MSSSPAGINRDDNAAAQDHDTLPGEQTTIVPRVQPDELIAQAKAKARLPLSEAERIAAR